jgi:gliding motility-associated-like protein
LSETEFTEFQNFQNFVYLQKPNNPQTLASCYQILFRPYCLLLLLFIFSIQNLSAQCTNGNQPECECETAPVLCTIDELDGYTFSMDDYQHPNDGPSPICDDANMSQTNNPTWFAFTAWCTNLTLRVTSTNCQQVGGVVGFQLAIYTNCNFNNTVACNADIDDCNTDDKILNLTGLNIGAVYYFMVDGCLGSYCTVTIDILGVCGQEVIAPWTLPVSGNLYPCVGSTETYAVEDLDGARSYHWFIDGVLAGQTNNESYNIHWPSPGTYQLCIDASNDPCVPITDPPEPLCTTITVHSNDAGVLNVNPTILCPQQLANITSSGFTAGSLEELQYIIVTDANGIIVYVAYNSSGSFTSDTNGQFNVYAYNFNFFSGATNPVIGANINDFNCDFTCCDLESQSITFQNIEAIVSNILCDDNGTGNDSNDDFFTFEVLVTGGQVGSSWQSLDGSITGLYGIPTTFGPFHITAAWLFIALYDHDVPTCYINIAIDPPPECSNCPQTLDAGSGGLLNCINTTATLIGTSSEMGTYQWTGPNLFSSTSLVTTVQDSGWYYLIADFPKQCSFIDSVFVNQDHETPTANAGADQVIDCNHSQVLLNGSGSTGDHLQYLWTDEHSVIISTQSAILVNAGGPYSLQLTNSVSGCTDVDTVEVFDYLIELEQVSLNAFPENCIGENNGLIEITGITGGTPPYSLTLNGLLQNSLGPFDNLAPGAYQIQITDAYGCTLDTSLIIHPGIDLQLTLPLVIRLFEDESEFIQGLINVPIGNLSSIEWTPKGILACDTCLSTMITAFENQTLQLTVTHINGCTATAEIQIIVLPKPKIFIPNTFSPNGDGFNDFFTLFANSGVETILELTIFDRWGELLYQAHDLIPNHPESGWDGKFHEKEMPSGTFAYKMKVLLADATTKTLTGDVTVVR